MVCVPCFIVPFLLFLWRFIQPFVLKFWNPNKEIKSSDACQRSSGGGSKLFSSCPCTQASIPEPEKKPVEEKKEE